MHRTDGIEDKSEFPPVHEAANEEGDSHERRIGRLFKKHNQSLLRFLNARLHSEQEAREIAQEAYVRLLKLDEPDTVSYLRAFLFRIAANLVSDRLKQRDRRKELRDLAFFDHGQVSPSAEKVLTAQEELALIWAAIEELPAKCRTAFLLHKIRDLSIVETADCMSLSIRMVRLYVARAIAHCKKRLDTARLSTRMR